MSLSNHADAYTEVRMERITYKWSIKGFDHLSQDAAEKIWSPWFGLEGKRDEWRLELYPRGQRKSSPKDIDYVALYLAHNSPGESHIKAHGEMQISKSDTILSNGPFTHEYPPQGDWGFKKFLKRSKLLTTNSSEDDQLTVSCIINIPLELITSSRDVTIFDSKKNQLSDDFRALFEDPIFSDFTIIVGDTKFPTHRNILAKRSPVFAAMFQHEDLEENRKREVKIKNIEPDVVKGMLEFIYTDQVTNIKELASSLLEAADKYDLEKLRAMCEKTLYEGLNKKNAAEVLRLADLYRADTLKKCVIEYIAKYAPAMVKSNNRKTTGWSHELLLEVIDQLNLPQAVNDEESSSSKA